MALTHSLYPFPSPVSPTPHWRLTGAALCRKSRNSVDGGLSKLNGLHTHRHLRIAQRPACLLGRGEAPPPHPSISPSQRADHGPLRATPAPVMEGTCQFILQL